MRIVDIITGVTTESDRGRWVTDIAALPRTAVDTSQLVDPAVRNWLARDTGSVVVVTDHPISIDDARIARVSTANADQECGDHRPERTGKSPPASDGPHPQ